MDYTEFRKEMLEKQALVEERRERRLRRLRTCVDVFVMLLAAALLAFVGFRLTR
jgi:hypothetical protein